MLITYSRTEVLLHFPISALLVGLVTLNNSLLFILVLTELQLK